MAEPATLRGLFTGVKPLYFVPKDDLIGEVLVPALGLSRRLDCMMGFFGTSALRDVAPGLARFLTHETSPMRLVISPHLQSDDLEAVQSSVTEGVLVLERRLRELLGRAEASEDALVKHTLACFAWLLAKGRLQIRVTLLPDGMFHPKVWILQDGSGQVSISGSSNLTDAGLSRNVEQMRVEKSWSSAESRETIEILEREFEALWGNRRDYAITVDLPTAIADGLISEYLPDRPPSYEDFLRATSSPSTVPNGRQPNKSQGLTIPESLEWDSGPYSHQGRAVRAWEGAARRGILEMATGAGKTLTSLVAATRALADHQSLLLVIAVPTRPLLDQWAADVRKFGPTAVIPGRSRGRSALADVERACRRIRHAGDVQCLIITQDLLSNPRFGETLRKRDGTKMLIADEVHNLGSRAFQSNPPDFFDLMLGLSATPIRQYDPDGTDFLFRLFGDSVFEFGLEEAIGVCLVPYRYHVHPVHLTNDEVDRWVDLSERIRTAQWSAREGDEDDEAKLQLLRNRRRRILDEALGKLDLLRDLLHSEGPRSITHTLIYGSDKGPDQVEAINGTLLELGIRYHQITSAETASTELTGGLLAAFSDGTLQVLSSKRVLDEGLNIPQVRVAYICASTTVERQWVQRRGRVLRTSPGKDSAEIHDFMVLPPDDGTVDESVRALVRGELVRVDEFARLAMNAGAADGPVAVVQEIVQRYFS